MADALVSGASDRKVVEVQLLSAAQTRRSRLVRATAMLTVVLLVAPMVFLVGGSMVLGLARKGIVVGGLMPCDALGMSRLRYSGGTITVLQDGIPVAEEQKPDNGSYIFLLDEGTYVLRAHYADGATPTPEVQATVAPGLITSVDIPNQCI